MEKKENRGGSREGSGRKSTGKTMMFNERINPIHKQAIKDFIKKLHEG